MSRNVNYSAINYRASDNGYPILIYVSLIKLPQRPVHTANTASDTYTATFTGLDRFP